MQYLLMCCFDEKQWERIPESQRDGIMQEYGEWVQSTTKAGHYCAGAKLKSTSSATTIRAKNGKPAIIDGPFAETKEQLLGFYLINGDDLEDVLTFCKELGAVNPGGAYEIRPLHFFANGALPADAIAPRVPKGA
jgi:hypothetical protein